MTLTPAQIEERRTGIGGSDAAAICGRHPHKSALNVWMEKVWGVTMQETEFTRWGQRLEGAIALAAAEELGQTLTLVPESIVHPSKPWMRANLDGVLTGAMGGHGVLECKNLNAFDGKLLGPVGTDMVLRHHLFQGQHYLEVTGLEWCCVAYLVGGNELRLFRVERDREFGAMLAEIEYNFWHRNVLGNEPPTENSNVAALEEYLARKHPKDDGSTLRIEEDGPAMEALRTLRTARKTFCAAEAAKEQASADVKMMMGDARTIVCPFGKITWATNKKNVRSFVPQFEEENTDE